MLLVIIFVFFLQKPKYIKNGISSLMHKECSKANHPPKIENTTAICPIGSYISDKTNYKS